jgi:hypothetical protein
MKKKSIQKKPTYYVRVLKMYFRQVSENPIPYIQMGQKVNRPTRVWYASKSENGYTSSSSLLIREKDARLLERHGYTLQETVIPADHWASVYLPDCKLVTGNYPQWTYRKK